MLPAMKSSLPNTLNAKLNPICHLQALLGAHHILHFSRIRVNLRLVNNAVFARLGDPYCRWVILDSAVSCGGSIYLQVVTEIL
jgi:hypothetical protein